jgi:hypothetical protein
MPDTIKSFSDLVAAAANNGQKRYSLQDLRDVFVSMLVHGEIGSGTKLATVLLPGWNVLDFNVAGEVGRGLTIDTTNKLIAGVPVDMKAEVTLEVLFQGANNTTFQFGVFKNPDSTPVQLQRLSGSIRIFNSAMVGMLSMSAAIDLSAGDKLQAGVNAGAVSFTLLRGGLRVRRIGIE